MKGLLYGLAAGLAVWLTIMPTKSYGQSIKGTDIPSTACQNAVVEPHYRSIGYSAPTGILSVKDTITSEALVGMQEELYILERVAKAVGLAIKNTSPKLNNLKSLEQRLETLTLQEKRDFILKHGSNFSTTMGFKENYASKGTQHTIDHSVRYTLVAGNVSTPDPYIKVKIDSDTSLIPEVLEICDEGANGIDIGDSVKYSSFLKDGDRVKLWKLIDKLPSLNQASLKALDNEVIVKLFPKILLEQKEDEMQRILEEHKNYVRLLGFIEFSRRVLQ